MPTDRECRTVKIRGPGQSRYFLEYPRFFLTIQKDKLRRIFTYLFKYDLLPENQETLAFLEQALPDLEGLVEKHGKEAVKAAEKVWKERQDSYRREWLDPNIKTFPASWDKGHKEVERDRRKRWNAELHDYVRAAKNDFEWKKKQAERDLQRSRQVCELYVEIKQSFNR